MPNDGEKPKTFVSEMRLWYKISVKHAFSTPAAEQVVFINLYWKDALYEKPGAFCKHKSSSLYNQAIEVIYSFPRSGRDASVMEALSYNYRYPNRTGQ